MRTFGIHLSFWQTSWRDDLNPLIYRAHQAGFDIAEFPLLFPDELDFKRLRATLDELGMGASASTGLSPVTDITSPDAAIRSAGMAFLRQCMVGASRLGSSILAGLTYSPWGVFPEDDWSARRRQCIASLKEAAKMAGDHGITLCLEVVNRFEGYLLNTAAQGLTLLAEVNSEYVKLQLDTFHMNIEEDNLGAAIRLAGGALRHLHCVENNRKIPGNGHIPWGEVAAALQAINFKGYIGTEAFVNPAGEVGRGLFLWRPLAGSAQVVHPMTLDELDREAAQAAAFMKSWLGHV
jgi:D-psicose/D-tagatose/L-ribulose 3-epimerase